MQLTQADATWALVRRGALGVEDAESCGSGEALPVGDAGDTYCSAAEGPRPSPAPPPGPALESEGAPGAPSWARVDACHCDGGILESSPPGPAAGHRSPRPASLSEVCDAVARWPPYDPSRGPPGGGGEPDMGGEGYEPARPTSGCFVRRGSRSCDCLRRPLGPSPAVRVVSNEGAPGNNDVDGYGMG